MDKGSDRDGYYGFQPYMQFDYPNQNNGDNFFNPSYQYEQGYMYYRYMSQMMDYKIKCKEYERLYGKDNNERRIN